MESARRVMATAAAIVAFVGLCMASACRDVEQPAVASAPVTQDQLDLTNSPLGNPSDFTRELLKDGVLTYAEYETAILGFRRCMEDLGWTPVREWLPSANHGYASRWQQAGPPSRPDDPLGQQPATGTCAYDWGLSELSFVWIQANRPSEEHIQKAREALGACLREHGLDVPDPLPSGFVHDLFRSGDAPAFLQCQERIVDEFDLPGFGG